MKMNLLHWLKLPKATPSVDARKRAHNGCIERLESRIAPATFVVTTFADELDGGSASDAAGTDHKLSLREAISAANATPGADTIVLKRGTYAIGLIGVGEDNNQTGDFDITDDLTIKGAGKTIIDGKGQDRVFDIFAPAAGIAVNFQKLTITHGLTSGAGGGVNANNNTNAATLNFSGVTITNNHAGSDGGGIANNHGDIVILKSHVDSNTADSRGGGIFQSTGPGALTVSGSTVNRNSAGSSGGGIADFSTGDFMLIKKSQLSYNQANSDGGGGEVNAQNVTIDSSTIFHNFSASSGGGLDVDFGSVSGLITVNKSLISQNQSSSDGGGIFCGSSGITIADSKFILNSSGNSGGAIDDAGPVTVTNSFFIDNFAESEAGAIHQEDAGDITLTKSTFRGNAASGSEGGAIYANGGPNEVITVTDCIFDSNSAYSDGGAIYADGDKVIVMHSTFMNNDSGSYGGAIDDPERGIEVTDSLFINNHADGDGGAFNGEGATLLKVVHSTFTGNTATREGGAFSAGGATKVEVTDSTISNNVAGFRGGGFTADGATLVMTGSTVSGNSAVGDGGGIYLHLSGTGANASTIINSTITGNLSQANGGGIFSDLRAGGDMSIVHATIASNLAKSGGGIYETTSTNTGNGTLSLGNTIVAKNLAQSLTQGMDVFSDTVIAAISFTDLGGNLIGIVDGGTGFTVSTLVGTGVAPIDPKLGPLSLHGGPTATRLLLGGSPAHNAALASIDTAFSITVDQRGKTRPKGAGPDIGAVES